VARRDESAATWARTLHADVLEQHRLGNAAADRWHRAALREVRRRGRCGATNRDGDTCERVIGHSTWHRRSFGGGYEAWDYDLRSSHPTATSAEQAGHGAG
jgi:hypothetical protein